MVAAIVGLLIFGAVVNAQSCATFVLVFVPVAWSGSLDRFESLADEVARRFLADAQMTRYVEVKVVKLNEIMPGEMTDASLHTRVAAFGARRAAGDRYVGMTDGDLRPSGRSSIAGWTTMFGNGLIAEANAISNTVHELGHTFGLCDEYRFDQWSRQNSAYGCPNPYPADCPRGPGVVCRGHGLSGGGFSHMGPGDDRVSRGFDPSCQAGLDIGFTRLFGPPGCAGPPPVPSAVPYATPTPVPPRAVGRIAFEANRDDHIEIYVADGSGLGATRVTFSLGNAYQPDWHPDGLRLVFVSTDEGQPRLATINVDGTNRRRLIDSGAREEMPVWSPDGSLIAFVSDREGSDAIYVVRPDGSDVRRVTDGRSRASSPSWSPDGRRLAFHEDRAGNFEIATIAVDGSDERRLTNEPSSDLYPTWSPDGETIVFSSSRAGELALYSMRVDGTDVRPIEAAGSPSWRPTWYGGGEWIAYQTRQEGRLRVRLLHLPTGRRVVVSGPGIESSGPALARPVR